MIDLERLKAIVEGIERPESVSEEVFFEAYKSGLEKKLLLVYCLEIKDMIDSLTRVEIYHVITGYAWGQKDGAQFDLEDQTNGQIH